VAAVAAVVALLKRESGFEGMAISSSPTSILCLFLRC
jgi:hypothetical protein